ncbi:MAG: spore coat protein CotJB [Ruminococcus sp.]|nr:spore coat protein CotJB [Ruminococcus sp.]
MNERQQLYNKIQKYSFAIKELNLYLDTHPDCRRALTLFNKYNGLLKSAEEEYARRFGPVNPTQTNDSQHWSWIDEPWPWERW